MLDSHIVNLSNANFLDWPIKIDQYLHQAFPKSKQDTQNFHVSQHFWTQLTYHFNESIGSI